MATLKKTTLHVNGMHCASCDLLVKDKFCELKNVKNVQADHSAQTAEITYTGELDKDALNEKIREFGYEISTTNTKEIEEPLIKKITDICAIAFILLSGYFLLKQINILPEQTGATNMSLFTVFVLGLVASTSTCMATSGALFLTTIGKQSTNLNSSFRSKIFPGLSFNLGRVLSYGVFGFFAGLIGNTLAANLKLEMVLNGVISVFMILIALEMLKLLSFSWVSSAPFSKNLFVALQSRWKKNPRQTAFFLGAITYLLPCGFTQSVQLYALGLKDAPQSALMMMVFALGTVPALLAVGFTSSLTKNAYYPFFQKVAAVLILLIGLNYMVNTARLNGLSFSLPMLQARQGVALPPDTAVAEQQSGYQVLKMSVDAKGYFPQSFTVKQGTPVRWEIEGKNLIGCQSTLVAPKIGVQKALAMGNNTIEFTPTEKGVINFSCPMSMYTGQIFVM